MELLPEESDDSQHILVFDYLWRAHRNIEATVMNLMTHRVSGDYRLPDNCIVIATQDFYVDEREEGTSAHAFCENIFHLQITPDKESWIRWAEEADLAYSVIGYIKGDGELYKVDERSSVAHATPRSWEVAGSMLKRTNRPAREMKPLLDGLLGSEVSESFLRWIGTRYSYYYYAYEDSNGMPVGDMRRHRRS